MAADQLHMRVGLTASELDDDALAECVTMLGEELSQLEVDEVSAPSEGEAPPGAKGVELLAVGALVVKFARSQKLLTRVVDVVRDWLTRNDADSVRMEIDGDVIEVKGSVTPEERKALIDSWVQRHAEG
jgi:hypothetical protein